MRYHHISIRMAKIQKNPTIPNGIKDVEQKEPSFTVCGNAKWYSHFGREFGSFLQS